MMINRALQIIDGDSEMQVVQYESGIYWAMRSTKDPKWRFHSFEQGLTLEQFESRFIKRGKQ